MKILDASTLQLLSRSGKKNSFNLIQNKIEMSVYENPRYLIISDPTAVPVGVCLADIRIAIWKPRKKSTEQNREIPKI